MISEAVVSEPLAPRSRAVDFKARRPQWGGRSWLVDRRAWFGLAGLIVSTIVLVLPAAGTNVLLPQSIRPVPTRLAGAFGNYGINLGLAGVIAVMTMMFVCYVLAVQAAHQLSGRAVLTVTAILLALLLLGPPLISTDVFSYIAYGRMGALYGGNPYVHGPVAIALDPLFPFVGAQWVTTPTAYGPLFTGLSYLLAPFGIAANVLAYKAIAVASSLVIVVVVWHAARLRGLDPVKAVALVGLNPVLLVYAVGGGHNDLLMVAILVCGVYVMLRRRDRTSALLFVTAVAVKLTAGLLLPFAFAATNGQRDGTVRRRAIVTGVGVASALMLVASFAAFGTGPLHLLTTLASVQSQGGTHSVPGLLLSLVDYEHSGRVVGWVLDAGFVACLVWLVRRVSRGELDWITGAGWATLALLVTSSFLLPWYVAWLIPLAALSSDRRLLVTTVVMTAVVMTTL